ncbi:hypothetical protein DVK02_15000 [Halobellus sp. Atlit-31R]|nr:hypothetical protein DVK02_15000 [Halobellus sp. Atlit-31R]
MPVPTLLLQGGLDPVGGCLVGSDDLFGCALDTIINAGFGGPAMFALLVTGVVVFMLFLAGDGDVTTPAVVLILIGGLTFPLLSGGYTGLARQFTFLALVVAVFSVIRRYVLEA